MEKPLLYYSTNLKAKHVTFRDALLKGIAPDRGLFMPEKIPSISLDEIKSFSEMEYFEIAFAVSKKFLRNDIPDNDLLKIVKDAYNYAVPLENVYERKYVMRLDQGPTASFKDFAARMMARLMQYFLMKESMDLLILTATSGDTGSAIANAFYGLDNIKVVVLFPEKEVTARQRKQMTSLQKNIQTIAIDCKFDDCQALVKQAFADTNLDYLNLSSANSINIGRVLPQTMYYFYAYAKLQDEDERIIFSVPSGNFGDLTGGLLALKMGLPVRKFIVATNENDEVPKYFESGRYELIIPSKNCISSAMNVGHPSNMSRLIALYGGVMDENGIIKKQPSLDLIRKEMYGVSINNKETKATIKNAYDTHQLLLEPHGAVAWGGLQHYLEENDTPDQLYVSLETAHPAKFPKEIKEILSIDPALPPSLVGIEEKEEYYAKIENDYKEFKTFLRDNY
ncbi:MAG: threonine synthase [Bacteroidota bacterium]